MSQRMQSIGGMFPLGICRKSAEKGSAKHVATLRPPWAADRLPPGAPTCRAAKTYSDNVRFRPTSTIHDDTALQTKP